MKKRTLTFIATVAVPALLLGVERPSIVLIVGDDIGFSDIGCYGSEIQTPNLDRLGQNGMRFTQFYNMAKCNPTRSSLMTGLYLPRADAKNSIPFSSLMHDAGYYTAMAGKEHFDKWVPAKRFSSAEAFEDSFAFYACVSFFVPPTGEYEYPFKLNGKVVPADEIHAQKKPLYKTDIITDYALGFLDKAKAQDRPFFLYLPYHSAHYPLQARPKDIAKYRGSYKKGWDVIRQERQARQKELGIIDEEVKLSPPSNNKNKGGGGDYQPWDSLSAKEQDALDLEMAVFAGMIDCMDQNVGRVLDKLEAMNALDNTLVLFFSDNGSCPYNRNKTKKVSPGGADSYRSLSAQWANVGNTPFRYFKQYGHEGGARTHFIAHWPEAIQSGINPTLAHVVDLYPTFLELAGAEYPLTWEGGSTPKLDGSSLVSVLKGGVRKPPDIMISGYTDKQRMVRFGDWKIVKLLGGQWELYNIKQDPTELNNLVSAMPEKVSSLVALYEEWKNK
ncbi:arylsulfatase [Pontiella sulfatireligans]|uniref:Arylsulfatase n=1 Tax=Pontiella sulfatireligans TaxID=2750658 RepID=A0A6C2UEN6_9BACT|nr:arylsulfatase [Pontiella sulfatireligans]SPS74194.1 sulfatase S1_4 [Kiritimatiellales bacterium]VGO18578.1 Arylsulfatase [Pontiella sulfatireligans]